MNLFILFVIWVISAISCYGISARQEPRWNAKFKPNEVTAHMDTLERVEVNIKNVNSDNLNFLSFRFKSDNSDLAKIDNVIMGTEFDPVEKSWRGNVTVDVLFLGRTRIYVEKNNSLDKTTELSQEPLNIVIIRKKRIIDHVFTGSVILLVSLLYINFGAALDLQVLKVLVTRPVSPSIGFFCQCVLMPLLSFAIGYFMYPENIEMQLGLFFTGISPTGGASNMWTVILGGNINLSVLMTTGSNLAALFVMPLWIFTLGRVIFKRGNLIVPYSKIAGYSLGLILPLAIGLALQKCTPRISRLLVRFLKPISTCLILFIVVFAIATNLYLFKLFSWQILVAGLLLPWSGYIVSWCVAKSCKQNPVDSLTIAIETGIQNTGIAIFLLSKTLDPPLADLTIVIPVAVDIMTMFPLLGLYVYQRCTGRNIKEGILAEEQRTITY